MDVVDDLSIESTPSSFIPNDEQQRIKSKEKKTKPARDNNPSPDQCLCPPSAEPIDKQSSPPKCRNSASSIEAKNEPKPEMDGWMQQPRQGKQGPGWGTHSSTTRSKATWGASKSPSCFFPVHGLFWFPVRMPLLTKKLQIGAAFPLDSLKWGDG